MDPTTQQIAALVVLAAFAALLAWGVVRITHRSLRALLDGLVHRFAATEFFVRAFRIVIVLAAAQGVLGLGWDTTAGKPLMEQVWRVANAAQSAVTSVLSVLVFYIVVLTVLLAALGRKPVDMPTCVKCGYSLHGLADDIRCPECGERYQGPATARRHDE
jgi:predicted RNA-binding Zn-ribbon protein involved in translation (DUF1610 family)